jgi:elongation of very long chain fatty acids protein 6
VKQTTETGECCTLTSSITPVDVATPLSIDQKSHAIAHTLAAFDFALDLDSILFSELLDTFFIVIHKKQLIFLHWYHHISVLLYCWNSNVTKNSPPGIIFCAMNCAVHSLMYFYYFLMAVHARPKWFKPIWITVAQISQMVVGVAVTVYGGYLMLVIKPAQCWLSVENNFAALVMYGSFLYLFLELFLHRYLVSGKSKSSVKAKGAHAKKY